MSKYKTHLENPDIAHSIYAICGRHGKQQVGPVKGGHYWEITCKDCLKLLPSFKYKLFRFLDMS